MGVNKAPGFPSLEALQLQRANGRLVQMDAMDLQFPDESFDLVISANLLEHVADPRRYLSECRRVLKKDGIAYFETYPVWSSARGHHVFEDMVQKYCPDAGPYRNDGTIIPDWGHLAYDEEAMRRLIAPMVTPQACDYIVGLAYHNPSLNRKPWRAIREPLERLFAEISLSTWDLPDAEPALRPRDTEEDYDIAGFSAVARRVPEGPCARFFRLHLLWRIKRLVARRAQ
jgi:SAM-dependent methyltransferase